MSRCRALALLLLLGACHKGKVADVTLDADRAAENATAAKTLTDLAAADQAAGAPLPEHRAAARPVTASESDSNEAQTSTDAKSQSEGNSGDAAPQ